MGFLGKVFSGTATAGRTSHTHAYCERNIAVAEILDIRSDELSEPYRRLRILTRKNDIENVTAIAITSCVRHSVQRDVVGLF